MVLEKKAVTVVSMGAKQAVRFWLQNRNVVGVSVATSENEGTLAEYQGRLYVVRDDAAVPVGRSLQFTRNTLPLNLKRAFGLVPPRPDRTSKRKTSRKSESAKPIPCEPITDISHEGPASEKESVVEKETRAVSQEPGVKEAIDKPEKRKRSAPAPRKLDKNAHPIEVECPYCNGANSFQVKPEGDKFNVSDGKKIRVEESAFFLQCSKCKEMFAVRLVPVTTYSAQVAGFK